MFYYFAPMEGVTTYIFRNLHAEMFPGFDKYFAPFIGATQEVKLKPKELKDIIPENNKDLYLVPQLLSNDASSFIMAAKQIKDLGYKEINLNLGCPSGTVSSKYRGSGFLQIPDALDAFLDRIYSETDIFISIKTRIGMSDPSEFERLLSIYSKYPISELIIHPRLRDDLYKNAPNLEVFADTYNKYTAPLGYNGDINTPSDFNYIADRFPNIDSVMIGRGCIANPGLISHIQHGIPVPFEKFREFHNRIYSQYKAIYYGDKVIMHRMKELWFYFAPMFPEGRKLIKKIMKAQTCADYDNAVSSLFVSGLFDPSAGFTQLKI